MILLEDDHGDQGRDIGGNEIEYAEGVSLDWNCGPLAEALTCYRRADLMPTN